MIVNITKAILHILDGNSGITAYSDKELDLNEVSIIAYITSHIEKVFDDPALRHAEFNDNSGFKYHLSQYKTNGEDFRKFSVFIGEKLYENISHSEKITSCDVLICDCLISETPYIAILKIDNKSGFVHKVSNLEEGVRNEIINHYAILPSPTQRISECAFINTNDFSIKYKGKMLAVEGERIDLIADGLLECIFDFSTKESFNKVEKIARTVSSEYGGDKIQTDANIKQYVKDTAVVTESFDVKEAAETVFANSVAAKEDFLEKVKEAEIPESFEMNDYVTKRVNKNVKLVTDKGIEISFPAEYYMDDENITIINNDDGTLSIRINNIGEILNK